MSDVVVGVIAPEETRFRPTRPERLPVGRQGQLEALRRQLAWCEEALATVQQQTAEAMRDGDLEDGDRWRSLGRLRTLAWKVSREVLPLVAKVPRGMQADPAYVECQRVAHVLRRRAEDALRANANYTVDLVAAARFGGAVPVDR